MHKSLFDSVEEALIQLQYALADYYGCNASDCAVDLDVLDAPFRGLRNTARSTQLTIGLLRHALDASGEASFHPPIGLRKSSQDQRP
jgi:hypothetical protein